MPSNQQPVKLKSGLYVPFTTFPELEPVTGSAQVEGISPFVQPVMVVSPYSRTQSPAPATGLTIPQVPPSAAVQGVSPKIGTTLWVPTANNTVVALTALTQYVAVCPAGWAWQVEEVLITFATDTAPKSGQDGFVIRMSPGASVGAAGAFAQNLTSEWAVGERNSALAASVKYYTIWKRGLVIPSNAALGDTFQWITNAARTGIATGALPDFTITENGELAVTIGAGAGVGEGFTEVSVRAVISWYRFS